MFTRVVAEVKFLRMYTCTSCRKQLSGSTERMSIDVRDVHEVALVATRIRPDPHHMPVGWGSYTQGIYCSECKP